MSNFKVMVMKYFLLFFSMFTITTLVAADETHLRYTIKENQVILTDCDGHASGTLNIPSTIEGYPVTTIAPEAFAHCNALTVVTIPESVTHIGEAAFLLCTQLTSVTLPQGLTTLEGRVFEDCKGLKSIVLPKAMTSIGRYAFAGCTSLTSITLPEKLTTLKEYAFADCGSLKTITLPAHVTTLEQRVFEKCPQLNTISFMGKPPTNVAPTAFSGGLGFYSEQYADEWETELEGKIGIWNNLQMQHQKSSIAIVFKILLALLVMLCLVVLVREIYRKVKPHFV